MDIKSLIIVISIHHDNTVKIAKAMSKVLNSDIKKPNEVKPNEIKDYDLIGFGSGIYSAKHHESLIKLADKIPNLNKKKAFIFSTAGVSWSSKITKDHLDLSQKLKSKGFEIIGDFQCKGFNTNSFLKYFGGMNKGRPNSEDFRNAEEFIRNIIN